jgi:hypothetical protein
MSARPSGLRPGQQAVIDAVLAGTHTLAIMPTGAGKSLCYCLYHSDRQRRPYRLEIHHRPWSLQSAHATITRNTMAAATHLTINGSPTLLHFARRQDVVAWAPTHLSDHHHRSVRNVTE